MNYIGRKKIEDDLMAHVILPKLDEDGLKVHIGECWFYIGGMEFEYAEPDSIPFGVLVDEIKLVLDDFYKLSDDFGDEYMYYYYYLCENI